MSLDVHIIEPVTGTIDPELEAHLSVGDHGLLFAHPAMKSGSFPLLERIRDYYQDADYVTDELAALIAELELAGVLFKSDIPVCRFLGTFHLVCCLAFNRKKNIALYAD